MLAPRIVNDDSYATRINHEIHMDRLVFQQSLQRRKDRSVPTIVCCYELRLVQLLDTCSAVLAATKKAMVCCYEPLLVQLFEYLQCCVGRSYKPHV